MALRSFCVKFNMAYPSSLCTWNLFLSTDASAVSACRSTATEAARLFAVPSITQQQRKNRGIVGHIRFTVAFCSQVEIWQGLREVARTTADLLIPSRLAAIWPDVSPRGYLPKTCHSTFFWRRNT